MSNIKNKNCTIIFITIICIILLGGCCEIPCPKEITYKGKKYISNANKKYPCPQKGKKLDTLQLIKSCDCKPDKEPKTEINVTINIGVVNVLGYILNAETGDVSLVPLADVNKLPIKNIGDWYDLSPDMPPIGNQDPCGTCVSFSTGYALTSYLRHMGNEEEYDIIGKTNLMSASFMHYHINTRSCSTVCSSGANITNAFKFLMNTGCVSLAEREYDNSKISNDISKKPSSQLYPIAAENKITKFNKIKFDDIKKYIRNGFPVVTNIVCPADGVPGNFNTPQKEADKWEIKNRNNKGNKRKKGNSNRVNRNDNNSICVWKNNITYKPDSIGGHAIVIVGYYDNPGYFKIQNSWDTTWGDKGYVYVPYDSLRKCVKSRNNGNDAYFVACGFGFGCEYLEDMDNNETMDDNCVTYDDGMIAQQTIYFETGKYELKEDSYTYSTLDKIVQLLTTTLTESQILLCGHTDIIGEGEFDNEKLSCNRANTVQNYLINTKGVNKNKIEIKCFGARCPVAKNTIDKGREMNRRVEIYIIGKKK